MGEHQAQDFMTLRSDLVARTFVKPIGSERIPCECYEYPCTDCSGLGYVEEPLYPADFDVGIDTLRRELDRSFPGPVCWGCGASCCSMSEVDPGGLRHDFCSGCDPALANGGLFTEDPSPPA